MLKLSTKCCISASNAQGSRGIIVAVQVGASENLCSSSQWRRAQENRKTVKLRKPINFPLNANVLFFLQVFFIINLTLCMTKIRGTGGAVFSPNFTNISNM